MRSPGGFGKRIRARLPHGGRAQPVLGGGIERRVFDPHQGVLDRTPPPARRDPIRSVRMTAGNDDSGRFCHIRGDNAKFMRPLLHVAVERSISLAFCVAKTRGHKVIP
jgi:hypothetical protein